MKKFRTWIFILASAAFLGAAAHSICVFNKALDGGLAVKMKPEYLSPYRCNADFKISMPYKNDLSFVKVKDKKRDYYPGYREDKHLYVLVCADENGFLKPLSYSEKPVKCAENQALLRLKLNKIKFTDDKGKVLENPEIVFRFSSPSLLANGEKVFTELNKKTPYNITVSAKIKDGVVLYESLVDSGREFLKQR
ncbi:MAG: hypothetical protein J6P03_04925 [Opitutales bacterium]|nr:hypothetical protein [Opitutales bacterium]